MFLLNFPGSPLLAQTNDIESTAPGRPEDIEESVPGPQPGDRSFRGNFADQLGQLLSNPRVQGGIDIVGRLASGRFDLSNFGFGSGGFFDFLTQALGAAGVIDPSRARSALEGSVANAGEPTSANDPGGLDEATGSAPLAREDSPQAIAFNQQRIDSLLTQVPRELNRIVLSEEGQQIQAEVAQNSAQLAQQGGDAVGSIAEFAGVSAEQQAFSASLAQDSQGTAEQAGSRQATRDVLIDIAKILGNTSFQNSAIANQNLQGIQGQTAQARQIAALLGVANGHTNQLNTLQILSATQNEHAATMVNLQMQQNAARLQDEQQLVNESMLANAFYFPGLRGE